METVLPGAGARLTCPAFPEARCSLSPAPPPAGFSPDANASLLRRRWPDGFVPDLPGRAREDGFELRLTPWLTAHLALPPARERELNQALAGTPDPARCLETLLAEPLWQGGYAILGRQLESRGLWAEATELRFLQACFFPTQETYKALRRPRARPASWTRPGTPRAAWSTSGTCSPTGSASPPRPGPPPPACAPRAKRTWPAAARRSPRRRTRTAARQSSPTTCGTEAASPPPLHRAGCCKDARRPPHRGTQAAHGLFLGSAEASLCRQCRAGNLRR